MASTKKDMADAAAAVPFPEQPLLVPGGRQGRADRERKMDTYRQVWILRCQGRTLAQVAEAVGLSITSVCKVLKRIRERMDRQVADHAAQVRFEQSGRLDHLYSEAVDAWERSKEAAKTVAKTEDSGGEGGKRSRVQQTAAERVGEVEYLQEAREILQDQRNLWGIGREEAKDAPGAMTLNITTIAAVEPPPRQQVEMIEAVPQAGTQAVPGLILMPDGPAGVSGEEDGGSNA
jgi:hypothetical protein